jgi:hypothetical protein
MKMPQGNSCYSYFKQKKVFFFNKNRRAELVLSGGLVPVGVGRTWVKGVGGWIWCKYCILMYVWKN